MSRSASSNDSSLLDMLFQMLATEAAMLRRSHGGDLKYFGAADFVLKRGCVFAQAAFPGHLVPGYQNQCFYNARRLANRSKRYQYVEGYALPSDLQFLHVHHAWVIDADGNAIDPTPFWHEAGREVAYVGVPFNREFTRVHETPLIYNPPGWRDALYGRYDLWIDTLVVERQRAKYPDKETVIALPSG